MPRSHLPCLLSLAGILTLIVSSASGYIHFPPTTLPKLCQQSLAIRVLTVEKHSKENGVLIYEIAETLKGNTPEGLTFKHVLGKEVQGTKPILDWVADGKHAMMFTIEGRGDIACGYVFLDRFCYSIDYNKREKYWRLIRVDPEMAAIYYGTVETLQNVTKDILAGKEVKVPVDEKTPRVPNEERQKRAPALNVILMENRK